METLRFSLDPGEHDRITMVLKAVFGVVCIAAAIITLIVMAGSGHLNLNSLAAIAFIGLFGIWLLATGLGLTERYVTVSGDTIVLKDRAYAPSMIIRSSDLREIGFSQLKITFRLKTEKVIALRLGTYYRENSFRLMEAVEQFCSSNGILTTGINTDAKDPEYEN